MATYVIGDLQGCYDSLCALLTIIRYSPPQDKLIFVGDLVNRGPKSLECLRFLHSLGACGHTVLGNHDLHLLAIDAGIRTAGKHDTLDDILQADDKLLLLQWLRQQKLILTEGDFVIVHAGLLPSWDFATATVLAREVEQQLGGNDFHALLAAMYGDSPTLWREDLTPPHRQRLIINALTRMRAVTHDGAINLSFKGESRQLPTDLHPWYRHRHPSLANKTIIAGHWSALGLHREPGFIGIDTGCVWGRTLTALRLEDSEIFQVDAVEGLRAS